MTRGPPRNQMGARNGECWALSLVVQVSGMVSPWLPRYEPGHLVEGLTIDLAVRIAPFRDHGAAGPR